MQDLLTWGIISRQSSYLKWKKPCQSIKGKKMKWHAIQIGIVLWSLGLVQCVHRVFMFRVASLTLFAYRANIYSPSIFASFSTERLLVINELTNLPGAKKKVFLIFGIPFVFIWLDHFNFDKRKRWGRGVGSGRGKTCGFGHQKSRSTPRGFEGGQTPLYRTRPKIGFHNPKCLVT